MTFRYYDGLTAIVQALQAWQGFLAWHILQGTIPPEPEQMPVIQVQEDSDDETALQMPGWAAGNRQTILRYRVLMAAMNPDQNAARKYLQDGRDELTKFMMSTPNLGKLADNTNVVDWIRRIATKWDSGADPRGGFVAGCEVTIEGVKYI